MFRSFRLLMVWLMAVAIPLQGMAATAVMQLCMPSHTAGSVDPALLQADAHSMHTHPVSSDADATKQLHGQGKAFDPPDLRLDPGSDSAGHSSHGMLKCHSAGFSIAGFVASALSTRIQVRSPAPARPEALLYQGVILDGLDRPPKLPLA